MSLSSEFQVPEAVDLEVEKLIGFVSGPHDDRPEKLLLVGTSGRRFAFYLGPEMGYWDEVGDQEHAELVADYSAIRRVDFAERFQLTGAKIVLAECVEGAFGLEIRVTFPSGELCLRPARAGDPDSDSLLIWNPAQP